ncbi:uncharacterized protein LOC131306174 [Rhododendron vialii]|uniref:uncharacterized protein LOC131306174 n=1 Tax=Rhododendron vialii TaxID=182163 RepID=UPI00265E5868|nr:uncharacterized protein LOC131306174 [Rhododendron vialii]
MACLSIATPGGLGNIARINTQSGRSTGPISYKNPKTITKQSLRLSRGRVSCELIRITAAAENMATTVPEKSGVKVHRNPPESKLAQLGVRNWPKWGCPPSKFPWTYDSKETCYLLKGKVKVYPAGSNKEEEAVEISAGDLVEFPKGMSCTWDVSETVDKHYNFE